MQHSCRFDIVASYPHGDRSLNEFHGNNQALIAVNLCEDAFDSIQRATANAYRLTDF